MSLNDITLPNKLLVDLYRNSLIEKEKETVQVELPLSFLGNNAKQILILVNYPTVPFLPDEQLNFLTNVLSACKLSLADIAILNEAHTNTEAIKQFIESNAREIILLGMEPDALDLPINFPAFQVQAFNNRTYVHAPKLESIENDKELKKQLWNSLKKLFRL